MTRPLTELFDEAVKFDLEKYLTTAIDMGWHHTDGAQYTNGARTEHSRRAPIDAAIRGCIEALEFYADSTSYEGGHNDDRGSTGIEIDYNGNAARRALAALSEALKEVEGK